MGKQNKKHRYHLEKGESNGWNTHYKLLKNDSSITVQDYEFLNEHCKLSKKDKSSFLSKNLETNFMASDKRMMKKCILWYADFIKRTGRMPKLNDYYHCLDIICTY